MYWYHSLSSYSTPATGKVIIADIASHLLLQPYKWKVQIKECCYAFSLSFKVTTLDDRSHVLMSCQSAIYLVKIDPSDICRHLVLPVLKRSRSACSQIRDTGQSVIEAYLQLNFKLVRFPMHHPHRSLSPFRIGRSHGEWSRGHALLRI